MSETQTPAPRRYGLDGDGQSQRLWGGKTVEQFDVKDELLFVVDTDLALSGEVSVETLAAIKDAGYKLENGALSPLEMEDKTMEQNKVLDVSVKIYPQTDKGTLIAKYTHQMEENTKRIQEYFQYKSGLYENFIAGFISNENYRDLRNTYDRDIQELKAANALLTDEMEAVRNNTGERLRWIEHFKRFSTMLELDRRAVIQLIDHIKVVNKTCLDIHFRYEAEFENAIRLLQERAASSLPVERKEVV